MAAPSLLRGTPLLRLRLQHQRLASALFKPPGRLTFLVAAAESSKPERSFSVNDKPSVLSAKDPTKYPRLDNPNYRKWKIKEAEILRDIEPIIYLTKEILHSDRYMDGECLTAEDEKAVVGKLLAYHPHCEDKIGCGLASIMVDRHPQFKHSRCLFVVRTDGIWIDFSYQKCLRAYVREKYPSHAERFIKENFKRGSS